MGRWTQKNGTLHNAFALLARTLLQVVSTKHTDIFDRHTLLGGELNISITDFDESLGFLQELILQMDVCVDSQSDNIYFTDTITFKLSTKILVYTVSELVFEIYRYIDKINDYEETRNWFIQLDIIEDNVLGHEDTLNVDTWEEFRYLGSMYNYNKCKVKFSKKLVCDFIELPALFKSKMIVKDNDYIIYSITSHMIAKYIKKSLEIYNQVGILFKSQRSKRKFIPDFIDMVRELCDEDLSRIVFCFGLIKLDYVAKVCLEDLRKEKPVEFYYTVDDYKKALFERLKGNV